MELRYKFTGRELEQKGFILQTDAHEVYFTYLDDPQNYLESKFLVTQSELAVDWLADYNNNLLFSVIKPNGEEIGEPFMSEEEIDEYIKNSKNGK